MVILNVIQSRDDQNEYERRQRQAMRIQHQQMQQMSAQQQEMSTQSASSASYPRSPSPVRVQIYSNNAVMQLYEKIKSEENFASAIPVSYY